MLKAKNVELVDRPGEYIHEIFRCQFRQRRLVLINYSSQTIPQYFVTSIITFLIMSALRSLAAVISVSGLKAPSCLAMSKAFKKCKKDSSCMVSVDLEKLKYV